MGREIEHQDGMIAKYLILKGLPESLEITSRRLARFCAEHLSPESKVTMSRSEVKELNLRGFTARLRLKAREDLRTAYRSQRVIAEGRTYRVRRVEDWPEYRIALEVEGLDNNGYH